MQVQQQSENHVEDVHEEHNVPRSVEYEEQQPEEGPTHL
jgi:hypothetical protein